MRAQSLMREKNHLQDVIDKTRSLEQRAKDALEMAELGEAGVLAELGALSRGLVYIHDVTRDRLRYGRHPLVARLGLPSGPISLEHIRAMVHPA